MTHNCYFQDGTPAEIALWWPQRPFSKWPPCHFVKLHISLNNRDRNLIFGSKYIILKQIIITHITDICCLCHPSCFFQNGRHLCINQLIMDTDIAGSHNDIRGKLRQHMYTLFINDVQWSIKSSLFQRYCLFRLAIKYDTTSECTGNMDLDQMGNTDKLYTIAGII